MAISAVLYILDPVLSHGLLVVVDSLGLMVEDTCGLMVEDSWVLMARTVVA